MSDPCSKMLFKTEQKQTTHGPVPLINAAHLRKLSAEAEQPREGRVIVRCAASATSEHPLSDTRDFRVPLPCPGRNHNLRHAGTGPGMCAMPMASVGNTNPPRAWEPLSLPLR